MQATLIDHMGSDLSVVNAARVSFGKKHDHLKEGDEKLIRYLATHGHISPFGHCFASFHVKAPIFVARQLVKHKFLRWNEISRRYVDSDPEFYFPSEWRGRSKNVKQGSEGVVEDPALESHTYGSVKDALNLYKRLLEAGVCPEQARLILPQNTYTEWYWSGSLDAFASMCKLRLHPHTQAETREVAEQIDQQMITLYPISWDYLLHA